MLLLLPCVVSSTAGCPCWGSWCGTGRCGGDGCLVCDGWGGALLGPEESGGLTGWWGFALVFLWLFGCWIVDASIFVAVLLRIFRSCFFGGGVSCLCCVCVCGDKL